ncbi:anticodon nuclease, partial [Listeria monocytogenes]
SDRKLHLNKDSRFFAGFKELALEDKIFSHLTIYADFDFKIHYEDLEIRFSRNEIYYEKGALKNKKVENIKISRGEENLFVWCTFLAVCELA